jgi:hypothetical protein
MSADNLDINARARSRPILGRHRSTDPRRTGIFDAKLPHLQPQLAGLGRQVALVMASAGIAASRVGAFNVPSTLRRTSRPSRVKLCSCGSGGFQRGDEWPSPACGDGTADRPSCNGYLRTAWRPVQLGGAGKAREDR